MLPFTAAQDHVGARSGGVCVVFKGGIAGCLLLGFVCEKAVGDDDGGSGL